MGSCISDAVNKSRDLIKVVTARAEHSSGNRVECGRRHIYSRRVTALLMSCVIVQFAGTNRNYFSRLIPTERQCLQLNQIIRRASSAAAVQITTE